MSDNPDKAPDGPHPRTWAMVRPEGYEGMSGGGRVAEGLELPTGVCVYWWLVEPHSIQIMPSLDDVEHIHTHGGSDGTEIVYVAELTVERQGGV